LRSEIYSMQYFIERPECLKPNANKLGLSVALYQLIEDVSSSFIGEGGGGSEVMGNQ
jgi:hypothetical protein